MPELLQQHHKKSATLQLKADKRLGQHFLIDKEICDRIALAAGDLSNSLVVEIGPGTGALTQSILVLHPGVELLVIERDKRFIKLLQELQKFSATKGSSLVIVEDDALQVDLLDIIGGSTKDSHILANLPYNIGTELLFQWLQSDVIKKFTSITVMLQKEVAAKFVAEKGSKNYSWLSIISQLLCTTDLLFDIPPVAFSPQPKVMSSLLQLQPRVHKQSFNYLNLQKLCKRLFLYRRKSLQSILKIDNYLNTLFKLAGDYEINMQLRPEQLDAELLCQLSLININNNS